jgi:hypothetical protein
VTFDTPLERFEAKFLALLERARLLPGVLFVILDAAGSQGVPGDKYPEATVFRLNHAVLVQYQAAVAVLVDAETALASLTLLRSLIEAWAHLYFICGHGQAGADCRALRLECGLAVQGVGLAQTASSEEPGILESALKRQDELESLSISFGCSGARRDYRDVQQTVKQIEARSGFDWLLGLWRSASQTGHSAGWDWLFEDTGDGTTALVFPRPSHRAHRLMHLVTLYNNVGQTSLMVLKSDTGQPFREAARSIAEDHFLARAMQGDYD